MILNGCYDAAFYFEIVAHRTQWNLFDVERHLAVTLGSFHLSYRWRQENNGYTLAPLCCFFILYLYESLVLNGSLQLWQSMLQTVKLAKSLKH